MTKTPDRIYISPNHNVGSHSTKRTSKSDVAYVRADLIDLIESNGKIVVLLPGEARNPEEIAAGRHPKWGGP